MKESIFQKIRDTETPDRSYRWYMDKIRKLGIGSMKAPNAMKTDIGEFTTAVYPGDMYLFMYDPKLKETLPFYDNFPLVIPFRKLPDGFIGLNLHYISPMLRLKLLGRLLEYTNDKSLTETTRFKLRWKLLDNASRFPGVHACVKRYLYSNINSRLFKIHPEDWKKTIMLPIDSFQKASRQAVYTDSRSKM